MRLFTLLALGRRAFHLPPRYVLGRLREEVRAQARRPWSRVYPRLLGDATLFGSNGTRSVDELWAAKMASPFFVQPAGRAAFVDAFVTAFPSEAHRLVSIADAAVRHEFDLLGSGVMQLGAALPWLDDFKTGRHYPLQYCRDIQYMELDRPTDVKVPWELSRCQHFAALGQAYWITGDERYAREYVAEVLDWLDRNPWAYSVNWACAMDVALRAISWIWGFYFMAGSEACADAGFRRALVRGLFLHGEFVATHLETSDVNGNHYLSDGAGLVFLGLFFKHTGHGQRWLAVGKRIVFDEIFSQVSEDGVDFEQSTAYHRLVLELFLTSYLLLDRCGEPVPAAQWERLARMLEFVAAYTKPEGQAPLIGDADDGRVQKLGTQPLNDHRYLLAVGAVRFRRPDFKQAAGRLWDEAFWLLGPDSLEEFTSVQDAQAPPESAAFPAGGFYVLRSHHAHLVIDCGEVGMRGRGGHGHNDILSFELFLNGLNVVTDCGAYLYTASREWRNRFRSTAFHNTVQVDDAEVNRFVGEDALWQLAYDAVPADIAWHFDEAGSYWEGSHVGYRRLSPSVTPRRAVWVDATRALVAFHDSVEGAGVHRLVWRWHLDPACEVELVGNDCRIADARGEVWFLPTGAVTASPRIEAGWVSSGYGVKASTRVIVIEDKRSLPAECSYVFADTRLSPLERAAVFEQLARAAARAARRGERETCVRFS